MGDKARHVIRAIAWGLMDIDDRAQWSKHQRHVFLRQINSELNKHGLHVWSGPASPWWSRYYKRDMYYRYELRHQGEACSTPPLLVDACKEALKRIEPENK